MGLKYDTNNKIEPVESDWIWMIDCMESPRVWVIFEKDSLDSDCMGG